MNPAQLLAHFDRISNAPDGVPHLRRFILDLAVRVKLVEQDPNDEPASELLERIRAEKARLVKEGKLKKGESQPTLPAARFDSKHLRPGRSRRFRLCALPSLMANHLPPPKTDQGIPFLVIGNVRWGSIDFRGCRYVSKEYFQGLDNTRRPQKGDILYALVGSFGIPAPAGS